MRYTVPLSVRPPSFPMRTILASTSIAVLIASCAVPPALAESLPFAAAPFEDVQETYPYAKAIEYLRLQNIFAEVSTRRIEPDAPLTRGAFVMLMTIPRMLDAKATNACLAEYQYFAESGSRVFFSDVPRSHRFAPNICIAKRRNIIDGYPDNTFRPDALITLPEATKILASVFLGNVRDDTDPDHWFEQYLSWMTSLKALPPTANSLDHIVTRGEAAEMIYRLTLDIRTLPSPSYEAIMRGRNSRKWHLPAPMPIALPAGREQ